uniref:Uncharacterized protein n=1 Tax=Opuntia streptacantha TaxID=393608 RepID=A0A7C9E426_OPUST
MSQYSSTEVQIIPVVGFEDVPGIEDSKMGSKEVNYRLLNGFCHQSCRFEECYTVLCQIYLLFQFLRFLLSITDNFFRCLFHKLRGTKASFKAFVLLFHLNKPLLKPLDFSRNVYHSSKREICLQALTGN